MFENVKQIRDRMTKMELEENEGKCLCRGNKKCSVKYCEDFHCIFVATELCVAESCVKCMIRNCRGCIHLKECCEE